MAGATGTDRETSSASMRAGAVARLAAHKLSGRHAEHTSLYLGRVRATGGAGSGAGLRAKASLRLALGRFKVRVADRVRGHLTPERLVAQGLELGKGVFISRTAYIDPGHPWLITIKDGATISGGVIILAHDASMQRIAPRTLIAPVVIGTRAFIGAGAIVLPGSKIGDYSIVGAGAVVAADVPARSIVAGNPARVIGDIETTVQRHEVAALHAPCWPHEGWTLGHGITRERMLIQRRALEDAGVPGYLELPRAPLKPDDQV